MNAPFRSKIAGTPPLGEVIATRLPAASKVTLPA